MPWYDLDEVRDDTDALWREIRRQFCELGLPDVPHSLNRKISYERQWTSEKFYFGQACGYDVRIAYADQLQIVATPNYSAPGCRASEYSSFVVVRDDASYRSIEDLRGARCVINTPTSHSGMNVLRALVAPLHSDGSFFGSVQMSGAHEQSLRMIQSGEVDVAAIDCVTFALLAKYRPHELERCEILHRTQHVPAPPFVTSAKTPAEIVKTMRHGLKLALQSPRVVDVKQRLLLDGIEILSAEQYKPIETLQLLAVDHDYREFSESCPWIDATSD